jgi:uncharacterized protein YbaP (TraB family)
MKKTTAPLFILIFFAISCGAQNNDSKQAYRIQQDDQSLLWEISGKNLKKPSFLFGTFHLMCKDDLKFSSDLKLALASTDVLMLELDMDDPAVALGGLMAMSMKNNAKLKDFLPEQDYKKVTDYFNDSLKTPMVWFEKVQPLLLQSMLYTKMIPCSNITSPEQELIKLAKPQRKSVEGLETVQFQASIFNEVPYDKQAQMLLGSIDSLAFQKEAFTKMMRTYMEQDLKRLDSLTNDEELGSYRDALIYNRNKNWVEQLNPLMTNKSYFVAVGAGHLTGKQGLITLLREQGYTLKPVNNKN